MQHRDGQDFATLGLASSRGSAAIRWMAHAKQGSGWRHSEQPASLDAKRAAVAQGFMSHATLSTKTVRRTVGVTVLMIPTETSGDATPVSAGKLVRTSSKVSRLADRCPLARSRSSIQWNQEVNGTCPIVGAGSCDDRWLKRSWRWQRSI
jgi:hypothetical protein